MADKKDDFFSQVKQVGIITTIPIILLVGPTLGYFLGSWIDRKYHIYPWFTIIFVTLGFVGSAREIIRLLKEISKSEKEK